MVWWYIIKCNKDCHGGNIWRFRTRVKSFNQSRCLSRKYEDCLCYSKFQKQWWVHALRGKCRHSELFWSAFPRILTRNTDSFYAVLLTNYRRILVLPCFSKILERIMYNRVYDFLTKNKIFTSNSLAFSLHIQQNMQS